MALHGVKFLLGCWEVLFSVPMPRGIGENAVFLTLRCKHRELFLMLAESDDNMQAYF